MNAPEFLPLKQEPFGATPDPRFLCLRLAHREALASLFYGIEASRGFLAMIAKPDMRVADRCLLPMHAELSNGVPRSTNNRCFNALSLGCALQQKRVDVDIVNEVAADFDLISLGSKPDAIDPRFWTSDAGFANQKTTLERFEHGSSGKQEFLTPAEAQKYLRKFMNRVWRGRQN